MTCFHSIDAYLNTVINANICLALEELIDDNVACILLLFYMYFTFFRIKTEMIGNIWL